MKENIYTQLYKLQLEQTERNNLQISESSLFPLQNLSTEIERQISSLLNPPDIINQYIQQKAEIKREILNSFINPLAEWNSWIKKHNSIFNSLAEKFNELEDKYDIAEKEVLICLRKYKWFITPSMPISFVFEAYTIAQRKGNQRQKINKLYYHLVLSDVEFLNQLLKNWVGEIDSLRYKSVVDIIEIIKLSPKHVNLANVVVPGLIVIVDGLIIDFLKQNELDTKTYNKRKEGISLAGKPYMRHGIDMLTKDVLLEILFQHAEHNTPLKNPYQFNRHKIIHGENKRYGRKEYLVRLILIIDYLVHLK